MFELHKLVYGEVHGHSIPSKHHSSAISLYRVWSLEKSDHDRRTILFN